MFLINIEEEYKLKKEKAYENIENFMIFLS